eukprot:g24679.t1
MQKDDYLAEAVSVGGQEVCATLGRIAYIRDVLLRLQTSCDKAQTEADADDLEAVEVGRRACRTARPGLALALPLGGLCFLLAVVFMSPQMLMVKSNSAQSVQKSEVEGKANKTTAPPVPECKNCTGCGDQRECLRIVDAFFETAPRGSIGLYRTYAQKLNGGDCPLCDLSPDFESLRKRCDVYDNAVAAIYLTKRGRLDEAQKILEQLYGGAPSGRTLTLLAAAYECDTEVAAGTYALPQGGFLGRLPPARGHQRSLEHNIDLFALSGMLQKWDSQERARKFVKSMYGKNKDYPDAYNVGTIGADVCDGRFAQGDGVPADGQFWNLLAEANRATSFPAHRTSLRTLLKTYGAVPASVRGGNGDAYNERNAYAADPGGSDTGMGFPYLRMIHVASTAWTGLAMIYQTSDEDEISVAGNPMKLSKSLPPTDSYCLPNQDTPESFVSDQTCSILQVDLAKALARNDVLTAGKAAVEDGQLRSLQAECEALKDEVTNKDGQIILLRSQLEIADRKLRLSDMENAMLKSELELRKRSSDGSGGVTVALALLEPYVFSVRPQMGSEYMPQEFAFLTDRQSLTVVVARSVLGTIKEENVVFLLDVSGSMQVYLEDVKSAVNLALVQQFHRTRRRFNLVTFTEYQIEFRSQLVPATPENLEEPMRFCQHTQAGGGSYLAPAAFRFQDAEAIVVITDGKAEVSEEVLTQVKVGYLKHPLRAKIHTVGINCVPGRTKQRVLQGLAQLTQGSFRSVCLEQDTFMPAAAGQKVKGLDLLDQHYVTTDEDSWERQFQSTWSPCGALEGSGLGREK